MNGIHLKLMVLQISKYQKYWHIHNPSRVIVTTRVTKYQNIKISSSHSLSSTVACTKHACNRTLLNTEWIITHTCTHLHTLAHTCTNTVTHSDTHVGIVWNHVAMQRDYTVLHMVHSVHMWLTLKTSVVSLPSP